MTVPGRPRQAVVLAGGRGTRLRPITDRIPKPMIPVQGKPFLQHLLELLKGQGFDRILILLGYMPEAIQSYFGDGSSLGVSIDYSVTPEEDDTGARVRAVKGKLDPVFMLLYCDNYWPLPMGKAWEHFLRSGAKGQITVYRNADGYTRHNVAVADGRIARYDKSAPQSELQGTDIGFALFKREVVERLPAENVNFEKAIYPALISEGSLAAYVTEHRYYSVGSAERLALTEAFFESRPAIILDRDGVLNEKAARARYITAPEQFKWLPGSREAIRKLKEAGYRVVLATNQAGVASGQLTESDLQRIHDRMQKDLAEVGARIDAIYCCKHGWHDGCECRKPAPGMLFQAQRELNLDLSRVYFIGDDPRDQEAGERAGCKTLLVTPEWPLLRLIDEMVLRPSSSVDSIYRLVQQAPRAAGAASLVLIGGCARSGKSRLAAELSARLDADGVPNRVVSLDSWLVSLERRTPGSKVLERYECRAIASAVGELLAGRPIRPPIYDPATRRRRAEHGEAVQLEGGVLIVEGVVALAIPQLLEKAAARVFVDVAEELRRERLIDFYSREKGLGNDEARAVIEERELEEVPLIKSTAARADVVFRHQDEPIQVGRGG